MGIHEILQSKLVKKHECFLGYELIKTDSFEAVWGWGEMLKLNLSIN